ncbi:pollen receptor-like kinase 4 [Cornus florida]|uniref:pollen receptor-like kinase 4 n=1 Tax=Cornus florida TaxID=4283 RepID=UPI0028A0997F|nr:pollen receptor-like kinase 4 [Cornus florida]
MLMGVRAAQHVRTQTTTLLLPLLVFSSFLVVTFGAPESDALIKFKASITNANSALGSWNPATSPCNGDYGQWIGVRCSKGNVLGLQLDNMGLTGDIDVDALASLPGLRILSFQNNKFEGSMPDFKKLTALWNLYLSNNQFSGPLSDDAFDGMNSLKKLYISNNMLKGNIPKSIVTLPKLIEARLEDNQFSGRVPSFQQKDLKMINLANNQLEGPIPDSLSNMTPSSFLGNKGVCGKPLDTVCKSADAANTPNGTPNQAPNAANSPNGPNAPIASPDHNKSPLTIVSIVVAALIVLAAIILVVLVCFRKSKEPQSYKEPQLHQAVSMNNQKSMPMKSVTAKSVAAIPVPAAAKYHVEPESSPEISGEMKKGEVAKLSFVRDDRLKFDLQDLLRASAEVLGSGNFGSSYKAVLMDGQAVVVKRFKQMNNIGKDEFHDHMRRLGRLQHPNLLPLVAYYFRREEKLLVFDYIENRSLVGHLHGNHSVNQPGLDWPTRLKIVKGVAKGMAYIHSELPNLLVPHGHLKSSNVLLDESFEPLLMDYTLVPVVNLEQAQKIMVAFKSPEHVKHGRTTRKTDVWSLGVLILEILTGKFPANYVAEGDGAELQGWVNKITRKAAFDKEMGNTTNAEGQLKKLFKIAVACCEEDVEKRWELKVAVEKIEEIKESDSYEVDV